MLHRIRNLSACNSYRRSSVSYVTHVMLFTALFLTNVPYLVAADTGLPDVLSVAFNGDNLIAPVTRWNIDTGLQTFSTPTGTNGFGDMARDANGRFLIYRGDFGGSFTGPPALFQVNPNTGTVSLLVQSTSAAPQVSALTALPDGRLLGSDNLLRLVAINPATLDYQQIPLTPSNFLVNSIAATRSGEIYAWMSGGDGMGTIASKLFTIDLDAGVATEIGGLTGLSVSITFTDMDFAPDGRLIAFTENNASQNGGMLMPNSAYEIDLQTGMPIWLASVGNIAASLRGFEFVPEPSSIAYLATSLIFMNRIRRETTRRNISK